MADDSPGRIWDKSRRQPGQYRTWYNRNPPPFLQNLCHQKSLVFKTQDRINESDSFWWIFRSVADTGCLFGTFYPSLPDPGSRIQQQQQKMREKKLFSYFFCSHKYHKMENNLIFEQAEKKMLSQFTWNYSTFYPKIVTKLSKYGFGIRNPISGIRKKPIPDPRSRGQKGIGSWIRIRNTDLYIEYRTES